MRFLHIDFRRFSFSIGLLLGLVLLGLAPGMLWAAEKDEAQALAAKVKEIFRSRCYECHGGSATQGGVDVLNVEELLDLELLVEKEPDHSAMYLLLVESDEDARMPLGLPALPPEEIELVRRWISKGAVEFPDDVGDSLDPSDFLRVGEYRKRDYLLKKILEHQRSLPVNQRYHYRYFSSHHLLTGGATQEELQVHQDALFKALNHLSRERAIVRPTVINPGTSTLFAVDLRDLGWHRTAATSQDEASTRKTINLYDLVLLEYPYGVIHEDLETWDAIALEYLAPAKLARPVPYVRADWFASVATLPPLYHDLLELPRTLTELEGQLGVDSEDNLHQRIAKRGAMAVSGVSRSNRAVERHPSRHGAYWKSIDYASSKGSENIFADPINLHGTGGEMIFNLPNGLQGYYITDGAGVRLDFAPTSIVTDKFAQDKTVRNGLSCIRCHDRGIKEFKDDVRPAIEKISGSGLIDKRATLELYPPREEMSELVAKDQRRFLDAMESLIETKPQDEPLTPVSKRFLDAPLQLTAVAGELGLSSPDELRIIVRQPQLTGLGLVALADAGVIRRDTWEDHYDQVVTALGLGVPVVPVDGLSRPDYLPSGKRVDVRITTSKKSNLFTPGDELAITIENHGKDSVFIELWGRGSAGQLASIVTAGKSLAAGEKLRFPETGFLKVKPVLGTEEIILYAGEQDFPAAEVYRGEHVADRLVHPFYHIKHDKGIQVENTTRGMIKRTLTIETR